MADGRMIERLLGFWRWWWNQITPKKQAVAVWQGGRLSRSGDGALLLRLPEQKIWRRQFDMPRSAKPFLRQIFQNEMDRRTPWRADQVYYHLAAERSGEALSVTLSLLPKQAAEPALVELARQNLVADRLELGTDGPIVALSDGQPVNLGDVQRWPRMALAAALSLAVLSLIGQSLGQLVLEMRLDAVRSQAAATRALAAENVKTLRRLHFPTLRRQEVAPQLALLNGLSQALPDDSWAEEVDVQNGQVDLIGISADPAKLIGLLQNGGFAGAEFKGPTTRAETGGQRFHVSTHAAP
jgi:general secretion pathway protein L